MVKIVYKDEALKQLKRIGPAELKKVKKKILLLVHDPLAGKPLQGNFIGARSLRAWPLRIIYTFSPNTQTVVIETVPHFLLCPAGALAKEGQIHPSTHRKQRVR